jgi:hypothetical protein
MTGAAGCNTVTLMRGLSLRLLLALCLLASTAQGFIAQTHVHAAALAVAASADAGPTAAAPASTEPSCLLCDIAGHSSALAPPAQAASPFLPLPIVATLRATTVPSIATLASHHWRGRGPPTRLIA